MTTKQTGPGLGLTYGWTEGVDHWGDENDDNIRLLSAVVQLRVLSMTTPLPNDDSNSAAVSPGDIYIMPVSDSNSFQDSNSNPHHGYIAVNDKDGWHYYAPQSGWIAYVVDLAAHYKFDGSTWQKFGGSADAIAYDSGTTGDSNSTQTNVADALDDLYSRVRNISAGVIDASTVAYDPSDSNSGEGTTVAEALDFIFAQRTPDFFYDIFTFVASKPSAGELVYRLVAVRPFNLPSSMTGSYASAVTASTGSVDFTFKRNGNVIGTVNFNASGTGTFSFEDSNSDTDISFVAGDVLTITAPGSQDATLADISFSLTGTR